MADSYALEKKRLEVDGINVDLPEGIHVIEVIAKTDWFTIVHTQWDPDAEKLYLRKQRADKYVAEAGEYVLKVPRVNVLGKWLYDVVARRLDLEMRIAETIEHENVIKVFGKLTTSFGPILVTEYLSGGTLRQQLDKHGPLPESEAIKIFSGISSGLNAVHDSQYEVVHCDIKPDNIIFSKTGVPKIGDFTSSQIRATVNSGEQSFRGATPSYMCPELQIDNPSSFVSESCDEYSLALLLVEMLIGRNVKSKLGKNIVTERDGVSRPNYPIARILEEEGVARKYSSILSRSLSEKSDQRYGLISEMHKAVLDAAERPDIAQLLRKNLQRIRPTASTVPDLESMIRVPAGEFIFGSSEKMVSVLDNWGFGFALYPAKELFAELGIYFEPEIYPPSVIRLNDFHIDHCPVTNAEYKLFIDAHSGLDVPFVDHPLARPYNWNSSKRTFPEGLGDHPVVGVTWKQAKAYARWVGKRLPSEEEWEKAARGSESGGKIRIFPWAGKYMNNRANTIEQYLFERENKGFHEFIINRNAAQVSNWQERFLSHLTERPQIMTKSVRQFPDGQSPYGVLDMAGNILEWTDSSAGYEYVAVRGGCWLDSRVHARVTTRRSAKTEGGSLLVGFRCAANRRK